MSYRGALLYTYYNFNVYFFKILVIHIFWANLVPKYEGFQIDCELSYRGALLYTYYNFNVYFFKILLRHIFWANLVPEVLQID